jgi:rare lipoprotein A
MLVFGAASCARKKNSRANAAGIPPPPSRSVAIGETETGLASWYGEPYHGRRAANGEIYDMHAMTAAHRTMPFGTWVRVDNLTNGKEVEVRITDRGPFVDGRIIDLSRAAAQKISLIGPGVARVKLTVVNPPAGAVNEQYGVQVGAYADRDEALRARERLNRISQPASVSCAKRSDEGAPLCRVTAGRGTREEATRLQQVLRRSGFQGFVVRLESANPDGPASAGTGVLK